jgi:hypothetical protein
MNDKDCLYGCRYAGTPHVLCWPRETARATYDVGTDPVPRLHPRCSCEAPEHHPGCLRRPDIATEQREAWAGKPFAEVVKDAGLRWADEAHAAPPPTGGIVGLDAMLPPLKAPTPAAMLGEAVGHLQAARDIMRDAGLEPMGGLMYDLSDVIQRAESRRVVYAKRETEAREGQAHCSRHGLSLQGGECPTCASKVAQGPGYERGDGR